MVGERDSSLAEESGAELPSPKANRFLARQPILNARREILGYELLFRMGWENSFLGGEPEAASRQMLDSCLYMGIETIANNHLAFINCTRQSLVEGLVTILPPARTVFEILETVEPDAELVEACIGLRKMGYALALDDFTPRPELLPLVELASYIKVDFQLSDAATRREIRRMTRHSGAVLIAEKVERQDEFDAALSEGFDCFQGYFFCRPKIIASREIPPNQLNYIRLLAELTREPLNLREVTHIVEKEPPLCFRLLRLANSPLWGIRKQVESVHEAFLLVGEKRFRTLASVVASCALSQQQTPALISLSLERARFCELLAPYVGQNPTEQFMLGLLSLIHAMLEIPMESIANSLPLRADAKAALLGAANPVALPLSLIRGFESGAWGACLDATKDLAVSEDTLTRLYIESVQWASESLASSP